MQVDHPKGRFWNRIRFLAIGLAVMFAGATRSQSPAEAPPSTPEEVIRVLHEIEDLQSKLPRDRIDPAAIVALAEGDPAKLMAWVRTNTRLVNYKGSLRGAIGVLMDRNGNSLDRSLLLVRLLQLAGYEARVVSAALPADEAAKVLAEHSKPLPATDPAQTDDSKTLSDFKAQADVIAAAILAKTGPLNLAPAPADTTHYWVQFNDGKAWTDLDPTLSEPGQKRAEPQGTPLVLDPTHTSVDGKSKLQHTVAMWLFVERWEAGKLVEAPLLTLEFDASKSPLGSTTMTFTPVNEKSAKAVPRVFNTGAQLRQKLLAETAWSPVMLDGKSGGKLARMFNDAGVVGDLPKALGGAAELGGMARSGFGGIAGFGGGDEAAEPATVLTALIADYKITTPGSPIRHVRRFIFDSIGPEARRKATSESLPKPAWTEQQKLDRGAELAALHDSLIAFASLPTDVYVHRFGQRVIDSKAAAIKVARGSVEEPVLEQAAHGLSYRTLELYAASRESAAHPNLVVAEPQIYRRIIRYTPNTNTKDLDAEAISDLAWNRLAPVSGGDSSASVIAQGVVDTLQESVVVLRESPTSPGQATPALMTEAAKQGINTVVVRDAKDPNLANYPGPARARMLLDLDAGQLVVAPAKPVMVDSKPRVGWWRVDPATAHTVGVMDTGLLQEVVEYTTVHEVNGIRITSFHRIRVGKDAHAWAQRVIQLRKGGTSWNQWLNLLKYAQNSLNTLGRLPPL